MRHLQNRLPLYKHWFEEAAQQSSQDWRLLAAIGYQESKWNPSAASAAGRSGLMQLTLESATAVKVANPTDPRQSIFGGARYFRQVYEKIPTHVPEPDRTWFALAAYNIGYGHLEDARVLAQKAGRDPIPGRMCGNSCRCWPRNIGIRKPRTATRAAGAGALRRQRAQLPRSARMGRGAAAARRRHAQLAQRIELARAPRRSARSRCRGTPRRRRRRTHPADA